MCTPTQNPTTQDVFAYSGASALVDAVLEGVKVTILAYGATSSGKTFTMSGLAEASALVMGVNLGSPMTSLFFFAEFWRYRRSGHGKYNWIDIYGSIRLI